MATIVHFTRSTAHVCVFRGVLWSPLASFPGSRGEEATQEPGNEARTPVMTYHI